MASLDSQGEIVPIELPLKSRRYIDIWESENQSVRSRQRLILKLLLVIAAFI